MSSSCLVGQKTRQTPFERHNLLADPNRARDLHCWQSQQLVVILLSSVEVEEN